MKIVKDIAFTAYPSNDVAVTRRWYEEKLGLQFAGAYIEDDVEKYNEAHLKSGCFSLMSAEWTSRAPGSASSVYFEVENVDVTIASLQASGVTIDDRSEGPACKQASFRDPEGNKVSIHESIRRLSESFAVAASVEIDPLKDAGEICDSPQMTVANADWEKRLSGLWAEIDSCNDVDFIARIEALASELPVGNTIGLFERGAAFDSMGHPDRAVPLYSAALQAGLIGERRRRAVIQMASSLRILGKPNDAVDILTAEVDAASDNLDGAVATFLALALVDVGREREAVAVAVTALSKGLPRYNRSVARYAQEL